jgi:hypothetical protein
MRLSISGLPKQLSSSSNFFVFGYQAYKLHQTVAAASKQSAEAEESKVQIGVLAFP